MGEAVALDVLAVHVGHEAQHGDADAFLHLLGGLDGVVEVLGEKGQPDAQEEAQEHGDEHGLGLVGPVGRPGHVGCLDQRHVGLPVVRRQVHLAHAVHEDIEQASAAVHFLLDAVECQGFPGEVERELVLRLVSLCERLFLVLECVELAAVRGEEVGECVVESRADHRGLCLGGLELGMLGAAGACERRRLLLGLDEGGSQLAQRGVLAHCREGGEQLVVVLRGLGACIGGLLEDGELGFALDPLELDLGELGVEAVKAEENGIVLVAHVERDDLGILAELLQRVLGLQELAFLLLLLLAEEAEGVVGDVELALDVVLLEGAGDRVGELGRALGIGAVGLDEEQVGAGELLDGDALTQPLPRLGRRLGGNAHQGFGGSPGAVER